MLIGGARVSGLGSNLPRHDPHGFFVTSRPTRATQRCTLTAAGLNAIMYIMWQIIVQYITYERE